MVLVVTVIVVSAGGDGDEGTWWWLRHGGDSCDYDGDGVDKIALPSPCSRMVWDSKFLKNTLMRRGALFSVDNVGDGCDRADDKW